MSATFAHPHPRRWAALLFISIAQLMVFLDSAVMNIALPSAQDALHFSDGGRQWVITAYGLAFGGLLILGGRLSDLLGRKRTFTIGLVGFALASALGGAATNLGVLLTARAGQGVFGALLAPSALALISLTFTNPQERAKAFGRMRTLAREVSRLWAERRTELEHPLGIAESKPVQPSETLQKKLWQRWSAPKLHGLKPRAERESRFQDRAIDRSFTKPLAKSYKNRIDLYLEPELTL